MTSCSEAPTDTGLLTLQPGRNDMLKRTVLFLAATLCLGYASTAPAKSYNTVSNLSQVQVQGQMALDIFKQIEEQTQGRVKLVWHDAGDMIPVNMHINSVSSGAVPCAFTAFAYFGGVLPIANIYSGYPFSSDVETWIQWLHEGEGLSILQETLDPLNIVALPIMATPREAGGFFKREIRTPEDFKGLRFRIGGWGGEVAARLGAAISQIPATELYLSMDRGRIDAMEFSSPALDESWGFDKLAEYYYFPGWHQPVGWEWLLINKKVWDKFDPADQQAIRHVCRTNLMDNYLKLLTMDVQAVARMSENKNLHITRFPDEVLVALENSWKDVLAEGMQKHPEIKKAHDSFMNFVESRRQLEALQELSFVEGK